MASAVVRCSSLERASSAPSNVETLLALSILVPVVADRSWKDSFIVLSIFPMPSFCDSSSPTNHSFETTAFVTPALS